MKTKFHPMIIGGEMCKKMTIARLLQILCIQFEITRPIEKTRSLYQIGGW
jgi:hypothetical protein